MSFADDVTARLRELMRTGRFADALADFRRLPEPEAARLAHRDHAEAEQDGGGREIAAAH